MDKELPGGSSLLGSSVWSMHPTTTPDEPPQVQHANVTPNRTIQSAHLNSAPRQPVRTNHLSNDIGMLVHFLSHSNQTTNIFLNGGTW